MRTLIFTFLFAVIFIRTEPLVVLPTIWMICLYLEWLTRPDLSIDSNTGESR